MIFKIILLIEEIPNLVICGINICHEAIDIHDPVRNKKTSGFYQRNERGWMLFLNNGFIDSFRFLNKEPDNYNVVTMRFPSAD
jgi:exodeoxyribonuclease-3